MPLDVGVSPRVWRGRSRNVYLAISYNFVDGASFSVWQAQVLQVLIYSLSGGENSTVGWISGAGGAAQVIAAIACGYLADKKAPRHTLCRVGALFGLAAVAVTIAAVVELSIAMLYASSVLWGLYSGLANPASEALFADSVLTGQRTGVYTVKWIVQVLCYTVGYTMNLILFLVRGNTWSTESLQLVMYVGLGLHVIALLLLSFLSDYDALELPPALSALSMKERGVSEKSPLLNTLDAPEQQVDDAVREEGDDGTDSPKEPCCLTRRATPFYVSAGDFLMSLGSGMTLRYLPLFFIQNYGVSPALLMGLLIVISVVTSACASGAKRISDKLGRLPTVLCIRVGGTTLLLFIAIANGTPAGVTAVLLAAFVARNALMNSTFGMSRSVIMDCVEIEKRARWSAFESVTSFSWAGSAAIGGVIADAHGYCGTFFATCALHYVGAVLLIPAWRAFHASEMETLNRIQEQQKEEDAPPKNFSMVVSGKLFESHVTSHLKNLSFVDLTCV